jgi:polysaccharide export outer membrane protein
MKTLPIQIPVLLLVMASAVAAQSSSAGNSLLISPGDEIRISVLDLPELEQSPRVTDTGDVPVQGVGNVHVAGMTPSEAAAAIRESYMKAKFLKHPEVSVIVEEYATQNVTLIGEFRTPGAYPISTPRPILDVIALGGGLSDTADRDIVVERHGDKSNPIHYNVNNNADQAIKAQVMVNPGDTVVVAKAGIVYVLGDVGRPGGFTMSNNESQMTLLEALSLAGGPDKTAKLGHARLIRKADHTETQISLGDIQKGKRPDFAMAPGDILFVPFSYTKNLIITSSAGIAGAAGAAAIYSTH